MWVRRALRLTDSEIPAAFATQRDRADVFPPLLNHNDSYQHGVGIGEVLTVQGVIGPNQYLDFSNNSVASTSIGPPLMSDPNYSYIIYALSFIAGALAAPRVVPVMVSPFVIGTLIGLSVAKPTIASGTTIGWVDITGAVKPIFCPPGTIPFAYGGNLVVVESVTVLGVVMRVPAGFKPYGN